jgi:hypothetical protein
MIILWGFNGVKPFPVKEVPPEVEKYILETYNQTVPQFLASHKSLIKKVPKDSEMMRIFTGYNDIDPFIVGEEKPETVTYINKNYGQTLAQFLEAHPENIEDVPKSLRDYYETDIKQSLKTISGIPQKLSALLLKNPAWLRRAFKSSMRSPLLSPVLLSFGSDEMIEDYIDEIVLMSQYDGENVYIHFDLMKNKDEGGFGAFYKTRENNRFRSLLYFAFHKSKEKEKVDFQKIVDICFWLTDIGVSIKKISFDQFQSEMPIQILQKRYGNDRVEQQSVERDDNAYMTFNYLLKKGLVDLYNYPHFEKQYSALLYDKSSGKVDHQDGFDKGCSDGVAGAVFNTFLNEGLDREDVVIQSVQDKEKDVDDFFSDMIGPDDGFYSSIINNSDDKDLSKFEKQLSESNIKKGDIDSLMREYEENFQ